MLYRSFQDIKISALGFGAMRLPVIDGNDSKIDIEGTKKMVDKAFDAGINYLIRRGDTITETPRSLWARRWLRIHVRASTLQISSPGTILGT